MTEGQAPESQEVETSGLEPAETPSQEQASVLDSELPKDTDSFDRAYVEKLRQEAAGHRVKAKELEPWGKFHEDYRDQFESVDDVRGFLDQFRSRDGVINWWAQVAQELGIPLDQLLEQQGQQGQDPQLDRPLTVREYQQLLHEQQQQQQAAETERREDEEVRSVLTKLKVPEGTAQKFVIAAAMTEPANLGYAERLRRGHEAYRKALDAHAASLSQKDEANKARTPGSLGGSPPSGASEKPPKTMEDARKAAKARLDSLEKADSLN